MKKYPTLPSRKMIFLLALVCMAVTNFISCKTDAVIKPDKIVSTTSGLQDTMHTDYTNSIIGFWAIVPDSMALKTSNGMVYITSPANAATVDSMFAAFAIDKTVQFQSGDLIATSPNGVFKSEYFGWHTQGRSHTNIIITNSNVGVDQANILSVTGTGPGRTLKLYIPFKNAQTVTDGNNSYTAYGYYVYLVELNE